MSRLPIRDLIVPKKRPANNPLPGSCLPTTGQGDGRDLHLYRHDPRPLCRDPGFGGAGARAGVLGAGRVWRRQDPLSGRPGGAAFGIRMGNCGTWSTTRRSGTFGTGWVRTACSLSSSRCAARAAPTPFVGRSLLDVLLEEGFQRALEHAGLEEQVQVTAAEDLLAWLVESQPGNPSARRRNLSEQHTGRPLQAYQDYEGVEAAGRLIADYCETAGIKPEIASSVKARLAHIYRQLTEAQDPGYDGLLMVIDEYEGWQKHHNTEEELSADAELLETLGYLLPRDLGYRVFTIVASQSAVPAKLRGEQEGDRFINIPLLAQDNEHDYDVIVSRRVRGLNEDRMPEINDHLRILHPALCLCPEPHSRSVPRHLSLSSRAVLKWCAASRPATCPPPAPACRCSGRLSTSRSCSTARCSSGWQTC